MMRNQQSGSVVTLVMLGLVAAGVLATLAYGSYYQIARGTQDTVTRAHSSAFLTQAAYTLATEAVDSDVDGIAEPPAGVIALEDGWQIPATSGAPKADAWGTAIKYCPWDNGSTNASAGRLTGANPAAQSALQFALVSAGPDKTFNTTCLQAKTAATGDDGIRVMNLAQLNQGVGRPYFYGDPVINVSALPASGSPTGMMRIALDTQIPYLWNGANWTPLTAVAAQLLTLISDADCSGYPPGMLALDASDNLHVCKATAPRTWKKVRLP